MTAHKIEFPEKVARTLGATEPQLVIGQKTTSLKIREWTSAEELQLGELADKFQNAHPWKTVEMVVSTMCAEIGGHVFWKFENDMYKPAMDYQNREMILQGMWMPDVFAAYLYTRLECYGADYDVEIKDPYDNNKPFKWVADVASINLNVPKDRTKLTYRFDLTRPIQRGGKTITHFIMGPVRWATTEIYARSNQLRFGIDICAAAIHAIPEISEAGFSVDTEFLAKLRVHKTDLDRMQEAVEQAAFGPEFIMEVESPRAKKTFPIPIDWKYGNFFKASSR